jgi:hypothetical protein
MLDKYRFVEPRSERTVLVGKLSYLWAGFLGPFYLLFKAGPRKLLPSLGWSIGCALGTFAFVVKGLPYIPDNLRAVVLVVGIPAVFLLHSVKTVGLVRSTYMLRNWIPRPPHND